ncbi:MAG: sigma-54-dependent Fis family transcriptional regulator [Pseudodesulfovibrio sp.]|uniref:Sigma-54 factor interaction domain-containing protein n=1 Tax=Pseudodesulfovibrio aespoeensis (strain ATCC 700646 / DSM 10631 / Aspo-2) TaxID=643562 RepID=E6VT63_PSEA9|nr:MULTISPECIES: sigma-54-dependent Fis family transcriptional regulator [Pseudodesulfovibrio]MBU4244865.1 sigma-54-dependent Fis family transcriptional regulator [Pseudomonadota bacterium]ADU62113.1 sigma-54 factor interaction domain-containing protein [Pseudodesulfovibrio aespoeensis Aspo-2]MBU4476559.1 sigma-54-dependent Fis family transcriptional regulator [Pseudomonadota bacterium]MBU4515916.1 sigma-54-dependent Fis family transcriptional regulator [Pseudomonadota bacterium]MBU4522882.1 s
MPTLDPTQLAALLPDTDSLSAMLDELPLGVAVMDAAGILLLVNKTYETLTGVDRNRVLGLQCLHSLRCDYCMGDCPVMTGWKKLGAVGVEANLVSRERSKIQVRLTVAPLLDEEGSLRGAVETITSRTTHTLNSVATGVFGLGDLVGRSPQIEKIFAMVPSIAQTDSSVLITGETGTGKDLLAEEIHNASARSDGPFVKVNCGALPDTLLESELFGHTKGAFTGADQNKPGRFRMAHGGTLFLTEIGDLPLALQVKLLSFLDDKVVYPLGSSKGFHTDVRVVVATHRDLEAMVRQKLFRQDLLYRLNVIRLHLPPLRERGGDIPLLQDHFLKKLQTRFGKKVEGFSDNAKTLLKAYPYPGNVRELRNLIEYAVNFCDGKLILTRHLPGYLLHPADPPQPAELEPTAWPDASGQSGAPADTPGRADALPRTPMAPSATWTDMERAIILDALRRAGGRKSQAAELLGWGRSTLWRKMKHHDLG